MDALLDSFSYANLDRDLPNITPAEKACVLAGLLNEDIFFLRMHAKHRDLPADNLGMIFNRFADCLARLSAALDVPVQLVLREVHVNEGRQIHFRDKVSPSYCVATRNLAHDLYGAIFRATDRDNYIEWLISRTSGESDYPAIPIDLLTGHWQNVAELIGEVESQHQLSDDPVDDVGAIHCGITNEHIEVRNYVGKKIQNRQTDTISDTKKKPRKMTSAAAGAAKLYRELKDKDETITLKQAVSEYVEQFGGSAEYIYRILNDNPSQWRD